MYFTTLDLCFLTWPAAKFHMGEGGRPTPPPPSGNAPGDIHPYLLPYGKIRVGMGLWAIGGASHFFSISYATHVLRHILSFKKCIVIK